MATNWTKQTILFELRRRGVTAAQLATNAGVSRFTVYGALERPYPKIADLVAGAIGVPRQTIWPQFYDLDGKRRGVLSSSRAA